MKYLLKTAAIILICSLTVPLTAVSRIGKDTPEYMLSRGFHYYFKNNPDVAERYFRRYVEMKGAAEVPLRYLARIELSRGKVEKAEEYLKKAVEVHPRSFASLNLLGEIYLRQNRINEAVTVQKRILEFDEFNANALSILAYIYQQRKNDEKAIVYYKRLLLALRSSGNVRLQQQAYASLGNYYYRRREYKRSIFYYEKLVALNKQNSQALLVLGELYKITGKFRKSVIIHGQLLDLRPGYTAALESVSESLYILSEPSAARYAAEFLEKKKQNSELHRAIIAESEGRYAEAEKLFTTVLKANPNRLSAHIGKVKIHRARKDEIKLRNESFSTVILAQKIGAYRIAREYINDVFRILDAQSEKTGFIKAFFAPVALAESPLAQQHRESAANYIEMYATHAETLQNLDDLKLAVIYYRRSLRFLGQLRNWVEAELREHASQESERRALQRKLKQIRNKEYSLLLSRAWCEQSEQLGRVNTALRLSSQAVKSLPEVPNAWFMRGVIYYNHSQNSNQKYFEKSRRDLAKAVKLAARKNEKAPANYHFYYGMALEKTAGFSEAEKHFKKAIELEPRNSTYLNYLGYMYSVKNIKLKEARSLLQTALELEPESDAYLDSFGWILYRMGEYDMALEQLVRAANRASAENKNDPVIYYHLAETYYKLQDYERAQYYFEKTLEHIEDASEPIDTEEIKKKLDDISLTLKKKKQ